MKEFVAPVRPIITIIILTVAVPFLWIGFSEAYSLKQEIISDE